MIDTCISTDAVGFAHPHQTGGPFVPSQFEMQLIALLPRMRGWALAMTHNRPAADDLVQDAAMKAWAAQESFAADTSLAAWVRRIMANHFVSGIRRRQMFVALDHAPEVPIDGVHEERVALQELGTALDRLPPDQRDALFMVTLGEASYEDIARDRQCAVGTAKSRVHRARESLRGWQPGEG